MNYTQDAFPILKKQNYRAYNRSDMYVPTGLVMAPLNVAALATPYARKAPVHSVPVTYSTVKARLIGSKGMATPVKAVNSVGS